MSPHRIRARRAVRAAFIALAIAAALLVAHYTRCDVIAKYPVDGVLTSSHTGGLIWETVEYELAVDGTGDAFRFTTAPHKDESGVIAPGIPLGSHVRVYYERRLVWLPWEGSTRQAIGIDWLPPDSLP